MNHKFKLSILLHVSCRVWSVWFLLYLHVKSRPRLSTEVVRHPTPLGDKSSSPSPPDIGTGPPCTVVLGWCTYSDQGRSIYGSSTKYSIMTLPPLGRRQLLSQPIGGWGLRRKREMRFRESLITPLWILTLPSPLWRRN